MRRPLALFLLALPFAACKQDPPPPPPPPAPASAAAPAVAPAEPVGTPDPDDAFLVEGDPARPRLWRIHDGRVQEVKLRSPGLRIDSVVLLPDGTLYGRTFNGLIAVRGDQVTEGALPAKSAHPVGGRDGSLWAYQASYGRGQSQLWRRSGEGWQEVALPDKARTANIAVAVDSEGRPWVSTPGAVFLQRDGAWVEIALPPERSRLPRLGGGPYAAPLVAADGGMVLVEHGARWLDLTGAGLGKRSYHNYEHPEPRGDGGLILSDPDLRITLLTPDGKVEKKLSLKGKIYGKDAGRRAVKAVDGQGRIWLASDCGLVIVEPDGKIEQWEPGRVEGFDRSWIQAVFVGGKGPKLPALGPKLRGEVVGKIPVRAPTQIEMCDGGVGFTGGGVIGGGFYGSTPCAYHTMRWSGRTDAEGRFRFTGVAPYKMSVVFRESAKSWAVRRPACCSGLREGEVRDLGLLN